MPDPRVPSHSALQASGAQPGAWDRAGLWLSGLCAVHCLLLPVLLLVLPAVPALDAVHEVAHPLLAATLVPVTLGALLARQTAQGTLLLLLGLALVWLALPAHALAGELAETALTVAGSVFLIGGHLRHQAGCRRDAVCPNRTPLPDLRTRTREHRRHSPHRRRGQRRAGAELLRGATTPTTPSTHTRTSPRPEAAGDAPFTPNF